MWLRCFTKSVLFLPLAIMSVFINVQYESTRDGSSNQITCRILPKTMCLYILVCSCKPRIGGRQCDRCAAGYYRFPDCIPCDCNQGGVTPGVCHPDTGRCLCKVSPFHQIVDLTPPLPIFACLVFHCSESLLLLPCLQKNVAGVKCDTCKEGSFYFDPSNPHGCTSCFCFGASDQCQSSSKRRGKVCSLFVPLHVYECLWKFYACKAFWLIAVMWWTTLLFNENWTFLYYSVIGSRLCFQVKFSSL